MESVYSPPGSWPTPSPSPPPYSTNRTRPVKQQQQQQIVANAEQNQDCETSSASSIASTSKCTLDDSDYGYGNATRFENRIKEEYPALNNTNYLDYAASPPILPSSLLSFHQSITTTLYSNPHSRSTSSVSTTNEIDRIRIDILKHMFGINDIKQWDLVWTSGATGAIKLVADNWDWNTINNVQNDEILDRKGKTRDGFAYLKSSHTSLVGIRGVALSHNVTVSSHSSPSSLIASRANLIAYPAQCNATGSRLGLHLSQLIKRSCPSTSVLLDAAAYSSTSIVDLGSIPIQEAPDFIVCSFYKSFGHPTGLGALIVKKKESWKLKSDPYFGGGTIEALSINGGTRENESEFWNFKRGHQQARSNESINRTRDQSCHERLENGTLPFLSIIALKHSLNHHLNLFGSFKAISKHVSALTFYSIDLLNSLHHSNGSSLVRIHHSDSYEIQGPTIAFTLYDSNQKPIGHHHLETLSTLNGFQIRSGGLCNTGSWAQIFNHTDQDLFELYNKGRICSDHQEFSSTSFSNLNENGVQKKPLGMSRISFGASSTRFEIERFVAFLKRFFVETDESRKLIKGDDLDDVVMKGVETPRVKLTKLTVYPIKSCGGQMIPADTSWPIIETGLKFDREWMVVDSHTGKALSQKRYPRMVLIRPLIDLIARRIKISAPGMQDLDLPLDQNSSSFDSDSSKNEEIENEEEEESQLCQDTIKTLRVSNKVDQWFSNFLNLDCQLRRFPTTSSSGSRHTHFGGEGVLQPLLLSNESPFLLITSASTRRINDSIPNPLNQIESTCFRANFELSTSFSNSNSSSCFPTVDNELNDYDEQEDDLKPFKEDSFNLIKIGSQVFQVLGKCRRCLMVGVDQRTGIKSKEPFNTLARMRKNDESGRIEFGVHLIWRKDLSPLMTTTTTTTTKEGARVRVGDRVKYVVQ